MVSWSIACVFSPKVRCEEIVSIEVSLLIEQLRCAAETNDSDVQQRDKQKESTVLLDVTGMMCGGCVSRVKSILSSDDRVESAVVNMSTETTAVKLKYAEEVEAEEFAKRLTECGFPSKKRASGLGVDEKVKKWKEMLVKKEEMLLESRNRVVFAWTLVALCCGGHTPHILHSLGIHVAHVPIFEVLHTNYLKGGLALAALLGAGRAGSCLQ